MENIAQVSQEKISVELIDSIEKFEELKNSWENVYKVDSHAQIFLSWLWLIGWLKACRINGLFYH